MKYDEATINKLTDAIANGDTIIDACRKANISKQTFYEWLNDPNKADFADAIKNAQEEFRINIVGQLEHSLWDRARGFDFEEQHTKYATDAKTKQVYVKEQITDADIIVVDNCMNNFGTYLAERIGGFAGMPGYEKKTRLDGNTERRIFGVLRRETA